MANYNSNNNRTKTALSDVLFLFTTRSEDPLTLSYEIECATLHAVTFTLNFEGSENFRVIRNEVPSQAAAAPVPASAGNDMRLTAKLRPYGRVELGKVSIIDMDRRASLRMGCSWAMEDPDAVEIEKYLKSANHRLGKAVEEAKSLKFPSSREDPNNQQVIEICNNYGKSFIDRDFLPNESSIHSVEPLYDSHSDSETKNNTGSPRATNRRTSPRASTRKGGKNDGKNHLNVYSNIEWRRPSDFMASNGGEIRVFDNGINPSDIRQGYLGDCWFLSALAALAEFPVLVEALFPADSKEYQKTGVYHVKFCKNGLWTSIRVDDYFPCFPASGPLFSRSNGNELWVLLAEKAYAKLHGNYDAIKTGWCYEAMIDLTGAPCKSFRLDDPLLKSKIDNGELWSEFLRFDLENYIMTASTPGEDESCATGKRQKNSMGLVAGHSYTVITAKTTSKGDKILKLRLLGKYVY
jgi:hypothetical protein